MFSLLRFMGSTIILPFWLNVLELNIDQINLAYDYIEIIQTSLATNLRAPENPFKIILQSLFPWVTNYKTHTSKLESKVD